MRKGFCKKQKKSSRVIVVPSSIVGYFFSIFAARAIGKLGQQQGGSQAHPTSQILALASPARSSHGYAYGPKLATTQGLRSSFLLTCGRVVAQFCPTGQAPLEAHGGHTSALRAPPLVPRGLIR